MLTSAMLIFIIGIIIYAEKIYADSVVSSQDVHAGAILSAVNQELLLAQVMPDGYTRRFALPQTLDGLPYAITVQSEPPPRLDAISITVRAYTRTVFATQDINGTINPGLNVLTKNNSTIQLN